MAISGIFMLLGNEESGEYTWVDSGPIHPLGRLSMLFSHGRAEDDDDGVDVLDDYDPSVLFDETSYLEDDGDDEQPVAVGCPELEGDLAALECGTLSHTVVLRRFVSYRKRMFRTYIHLLDRPALVGSGLAEAVEAFQTTLETYHACLMQQNLPAARQQLAAIAQLSIAIDSITQHQ
jgi:hypothetical protein